MPIPLAPLFVLGAAFLKELVKTSSTSSPSGGTPFTIYNVSPGYLQIFLEQYPNVMTAEQAIDTVRKNLPSALPEIVDAIAGARRRHPGDVLFIEFE